MYFLDFYSHFFAIIVKNPSKGRNIFDLEVQYIYANKSVKESQSFLLSSNPKK